MLLKTPQLGVAQGSPVPAVENQQYRTIPLAQLRKRYRTSIDPSEHEIRRALPNAKRVPRRWNIPAFVEHAEAEKPEQYEAQQADHSAADSSASHFLVRSKYSTVLKPRVIALPAPDALGKPLHT